ncbi:MAG: ATP-binding protein, partial [Desulfobacula sp.]|nr:ATP-binding protein [Desulfobacula sp.]
VLHGSGRAKDLVSQILTFSHQSGYEKQPLKLRLIVIEALTLLRASIPAFIDIKKKLHSNGYILADHTQIHQVIMNLCTNAWHAMQKEGGTLSVELKDMKLSSANVFLPADLTPGQYLVLSIKDTGCGIRADLVEKIFDPYFTTKAKDKGTGLGLSVVLGIVSKCDGAITIDTQEGKGTAFHVFFPEFFPHIEQETALEPLILGNNEHILFVDDETFQIEMTQDLLEQLGYQVTTCPESLRALELFIEKKDEFDLVITDMVMPIMTGKTLASKILDIRPDIPVILSTGYSDDIDNKDLQRIGIAQCLMKPFGMADLGKAIHSAIHSALQK